MNTELREGYHRDPKKMVHHYDLELVWRDGAGTRTICKLGHIDHMGDTKHMLYDRFPRIPKSHWECLQSYRYDDVWRKGEGMWLRIHHTADFEWRHWDTWRMWRPWKEWLNIDTYEQAVKTAEQYKKVKE